MNKTFEKNKELTLTEFCDKVCGHEGMCEQCFLGYRPKEDWNKKIKDLK